MGSRAVFSCLAAVALGCSGNAGPPDAGVARFDAGPMNPAPTLSSVAPATLDTLSAPQPLNLTGTQFLDGCQALFDDVPRPLLRASDTQATLALTAADLRVPRRHRVRVQNPGPGGGLSEELAFTVTGAAPVPRVDALRPASVRAGSAAVKLQVTGGNFAPTSAVQWNGSPRTTRFVSTVALEADVGAADLVSPGTATVTVVTPAPGGGTSNGAAFTVEAAASGLVRASLRSDGGELGSDTHFFVLSPDGRFVAFVSSDVDVVAGDTNGAADVFLRDTCVGATACAPSTTRVSLAADGGQLTRATDVLGLSAGGRYVLLRSDAPGLLPDFAGGEYTFVVRDTCVGAGAGCTPANTAVMLRVDGGIGSSGEPYAGALSPNGRFVTFIHDGEDLVPDDANARADAFLRDTCLGAPSGCVPATELVSRTEDGGQLLTFGVNSLSGTSTGRRVSFSTRDDGVTSDDTSAGEDLFQRDTCRGASGCTPTTTKVSFGPQGQRASPTSTSGAAQSGGERFACFQSSASFGFGEGNGGLDVFVRDTCAGAVGCTPTTRLASASPDGGTGNKASGFQDTQTLSNDGRYVAFTSLASDLVSGDGNGNLDAFVRDTCAGAAGCTPRTVVLSQAPGGAPVGSNSYGPAISGDGHFAAFVSGAATLVPGDTNGRDDVFVVGTGL